MSFKASPICFQPLDLAPFGPLKAKLETLSSAWHHDNKGEVLNKYTLMPNVAYQAFEEVFSNRELIKTGFRIAGLFPWNRAAVHWEKLAPGSLYAEKRSQGEAVVVTDEMAAVIELSAEMAGNMDLTETRWRGTSSLWCRVRPGKMLWRRMLLGLSTSPGCQPWGLGLLENQVNNKQCSCWSRHLHFVQEHGTNLVEIFPESNHEEKVHLLQR